MSFVLHFYLAAVSWAIRQEDLAAELYKHGATPNVMTFKAGTTFMLVADFWNLIQVLLVTGNPGIWATSIAIWCNFLGNLLCAIYLMMLPRFNRAGHNSAALVAYGGNNMY